MLGVLPLPFDQDSDATDSYYCMMIGTDHSEVSPYCQSGTNDPRPQDPHSERAVALPLVALGARDGAGNSSARVGSSSSANGLPSARPPALAAGHPLGVRCHERVCRSEQASQICVS